MSFRQKYDEWLCAVEKELDRMVTDKPAPEGTIYKAMRYSLLAGGKRLRPVLALAVCDMLGGNSERVLPFACAIEMIHTYSLIHDDLPAMDNDDFRRGKPTNHKVFGEAAAVLAGDALLNRAFEVMVSACLSKEENLKAGVMAMGIIAEASGASGMIAGQVVDLESEDKEIPVDRLEYMHRCKTGALIKAPVLAAAVLCGANDSEVDALKLYSEKIGLAFQVKDDILDVEGSFENMGKTLGKDAVSGKSTFVSIYGLEKSKQLLVQIINDAIDALKPFGEKACFLKELAAYIGKRSN